MHPATHPNLRFGWTTEAELGFIAGLAESKRAAELLAGYLRALERRVDFGQMDRAEVIDYAKASLETAQRG